jgi:hypothetical protein
MYYTCRYYSLMWCDAVYSGINAQTLQQIVEESPYATSKTKKAGVEYVCLAMIRKEMISLCNSLVCHADSLYQRRIGVSETSDKSQNHKKEIPLLCLLPATFRYFFVHSANECCLVPKGLYEQANIRRGKPCISCDADGLQCERNDKLIVGA